MKKGSAFCSRCGTSLETETQDGDREEEDEPVSEPEAEDAAGTVPEEDIFAEEELTEE